MKIFRTMFIPVMPSLLVAIAVALAWGMGAPAGAASTDTSLQVAVSGLSGTVTESVSFSGKALIRAKVVEDPDFRTPPIVLLSIDLSGISGVGTLSRKKYVTTNTSLVQRRLRASDSIQFTFPFWPSGTSGSTTDPVGAVSFSLSFDLNTWTLTGVTGSITSP
jgi:hypothetical protein